MIPEVTFKPGGAVQVHYLDSNFGLLLQLASSRITQQLGGATITLLSYCCGSFYLKTGGSIECTRCWAMTEVGQELQLEASTSTLPPFLTSLRPILSLTDFQFKQIELALTLRLNLFLEDSLKPESAQAGIYEKYSGVLL